MVCCSFDFRILGVVPVLLAIYKIYNKLSIGWCRSQTCLVGKTALVTGANIGIGYETAIDFAKRGARVILACRNLEKANEAKDNIIRETRNDNIVVKLIDMSSLTSVRAFAKDILRTENRLDILVNNAGAGGLGQAITDDGLQLGMQVNFFAPFLLTILLLGLLKKTGNSRIVNVSSIAGKHSRLDVNNLNGYPGDFKLYARSKLCNILFTRELASRIAATSVTTYSLHPGLVMTDFFKNMTYAKKTLLTFLFRTFYKNQVEGAQTTIYTSVQQGIEEYNGEHFHDCHVVKAYKTAADMSRARKVWELAENMVKLTGDERKNLH